MKQLGILDSAFINMEHKSVPQHIGSIGIYDQSTAPDGKVRFKSLIKHFERQIKKIPLFRTRLMQSPGGFTRPYWIVDDNFDVEFHLRHIALPHPGDWRQLCIQVARLHSRPLDMSRPLWEAYVIEGLKDIDGIPKDCFAIYVKIHHSLIDGGGGANFMAAIHDLEPIAHDEDLPDEVYEAEQRPTSMKMFNTSSRHYFDNAWNLTKGGYQLTQDMAKTAVKLVKGELKPPPIDAPTTRFNNPVSPYRVVESSTFSFADLCEIKDTTNTKVNDVALAVISGAMSKYLAAKNETPATSLVASLPINMRTRTGDTGEANQVGSIFTSLNSDIEDPLERLHAIHRSTNEAKQFGENTPVRDALKLAGAMSPRLSKRLLNAYIDNKLTRHSPLKINTVISNVAGPNFPLYCSGAKLLRYHGLGVLTAGVGIFHLVFTYCDEITITVLADREIMPDPDFYRKCMDKSFAELKTAVKKDQKRKLLEAEKLVSKASQDKQAKTDTKEAANANTTAAMDTSVKVESQPVTVTTRKAASSKKTAPTSNTAEKITTSKTASVAKSRKRSASSKTASSKTQTADKPAANVAVKPAAQAQSIVANKPAPTEAKTATAAMDAEKAQTATKEV